MDIEFDPIKAQTNFRKHGISFSHAEQVFYDPLAITTEDTNAAGEQRFITIGRDALGQLLVVVYTWHGSRIRLISARKASKKEMENYYA
jgi:uncharacterized DUF497 family protein